MPKKPSKLPEIGWIQNKGLQKAVNKLLLLNPEYLKQPSSITGKHHKGEDRKQHIQMALIVMKCICEELQIKGIRRDVLYSAIILHDIGYIKSIKPGKVYGWKYYAATNWSSKSRDMNVRHPIYGFEIVMASDIPNRYRTTIANMILKHMAHWYNIGTPNPETEEEKYVALSDYIASRKDIIFTDIEGI